MSNAKKLTGLVLLVALVGVGAVLYFGFLKTAPNQNDTANVNQTPASKSPAKEHILGLSQASAQAPSDAGTQKPQPAQNGANAQAAPATQSLDAFMKAEYDRQNAECKRQNPNTDLAMGVTHVVRDSFALVSLGCGESGTSGYYAKVNNQWQLAFKTEDTPTCADVEKFKFTKEIVPECSTGGDTSDNVNP